MTAGFGAGAETRLLSFVEFDNPKSKIQNLNRYAEVAKLVDALVLGTSVERHASSSLALGTIFSDQRPVVGCQK